MDQRRLIFPERQQTAAVTSTAFDENRPRWSLSAWAPPSDEDPDSEVEGGFR
jgi:hypothetical protein